MVTLVCKLFMQLGALAVVIRQTNIVWILFVCCCEVINITLVGQRDKIDVDDTDYSVRKNSRPTPKNSVSNLRKRKVSTAADTEICSMAASSVSSQNYTSGFIFTCLVELLLSFMS